MATQSNTEFSKTGTFITPGLVIKYAGAVSPAGWLLCQGQSLLRSAYPQLFAVLGTTYNTQIDPTTGLAWSDPGALYFRVPDYRGLLMRSVGTASGLDTVTVGGYQGHKSAANGLSTSLDGAHGHSMNNSAFTFDGGSGVGSPAGALSNDGPPNYPYRSTNFAGTWTNLANGVPGGTSGNGGHGHGFSGDNETRPINKGVYFIIKY